MKTELSKSWAPTIGVATVASLAVGVLAIASSQGARPAVGPAEAAQMTREDLADISPTLIAEQSDPDKLPAHLVSGPLAIEGVDPSSSRLLAEREDLPKEIMQHLERTGLTRQTEVSTFTDLGRTSYVLTPLGKSFRNCFSIKTTRTS